MSTAVSRKTESNRDYPTSDGRPMAETDLHRCLMMDLIQTLEAYFAADPMVYVSGNLLVYYVPGNKRKHLAPDVFVVKGVAKKKRINYLTWQEGKGPDVVIELTSSSTQAEDVKSKFQLYQDVLHVPEYFLFDPYEDYLDPSMQGYRLQKGKYVAIKPVRQRLASKVLGLELERHGEELRLFNPVIDAWLPTVAERVAESELNVARKELERRRVESENEQLRQEVEDLRRKLGK
jgi:Uma2 family endonuclease